MFFLVMTGCSPGHEVVKLLKRRSSDSLRLALFLSNGLLGNIAQNCLGLLFFLNQYHGINASFF